MIEVTSLSDKRLLIEGILNGRKHVFLLDTGASVSLISKRIKGLDKGRRYNGKLIGAGGGLETSYVCNDLVDIQGRMFGQFVICDIDAIVTSIQHQTGIAISGIIGLPQMKANNMQVDFNDNLILFEE